MRIPNFAISDSLVSRLQKLTAAQSNLQAQVSSGQRITVASDDPAAMARVLDFQAEKQHIQQWTRNGDRALGVSQASFAAVKELKSVSDRAGEIAVLGVGATGADAYHAYATETDALIEHALQVANTQHAGEQLFGGTQTNTPPFTATRDAAGHITAVSYTGAASAAQYRVYEAATISPQTDGATNQKFADFLNHLVSLRDSLKAQDGPGVQTVQAALHGSETDLLGTLSDIGATQTRLEASQGLNQSRFTDLQQLTSSETDVDLAQTVVKLTQSQTAYQAALQSGAQILQHSLLDYLR
jgi:flagellar hook-associated protein 3 FlgL